MKLDPNSREELPAVVRVAAQIASGLYADPHRNGTHKAFIDDAMNAAHALIAAYNESQPEEASAKPMPTREEMIDRLREISGISLREAYRAINYILDGEAK